MKKSILILIATLALLGAAVAQEREDKKEREAQELQTKERQAKERQELEKKTVAFLNEVASAAWGLKTVENRTYVMVAAADLLWSYDQKRARSLYWDVLNIINSSPEIRPAKEQLDKAEHDKIVDAYFKIFSLRQKVVRQVARRDAQLALDMLRATRQVPPRPYTAEIPFPDEQQLEQEIATEVAASDPAQALRFARESLAKGLSFELLNLLQDLNHKDAEKALMLAGEIITKLRSSNIAGDLRASVLAVQLLELSRTQTDGVVSRLSSAPLSYEPERLGLTDEQRRDLTDSLTNAALATSANSHLLFQILELTPEIDQFFPERRSLLDKKLAAFKETLNPEQRQQDVYNTLIRRGEAEELVRKAATAGEQDRLVLYQQAAIIALSRGQSDSFRELIGKEIKDEDEQKKILEALDAEEISVAAGRKQIENLQKLIPKIRRKEERARAMAELALLLKEKGDDLAAASMLDDAATLIKTDLKSETQTNALLTLLTAYAVIDPAKAFALAERTVDQANKQISTLMLIDRVIKSGAIKKGEVLLEHSGIMPLDLIIFRYGKGVEALATVDFSRTRALADRFDRNELRLMARLLIIKTLLQPAASSGNRIFFGRM